MPFFALSMALFIQAAEAQRAVADAFFSAPAKRPVLVLIIGGKR